MIVGILFYLNPYRDPVLNGILIVIDIICLIALLFYVKKIVDISEDDDINVSAGSLWAYAIILTPIFSIALAILSVLARAGRAFTRQGEEIRSGVLEVKSTVIKMNEETRDSLAYSAIPSTYVPQEQADTEAQTDMNVQFVPTEPSQVENNEGFCNLCGKENRSKKKHRINGKEINICLSCCEVINAMKYPDKSKQCFDYLVDLLRKDPKSRTYIGPILMGNQKTAEMFRKFLSSPEGRKLFP